MSIHDKDCETGFRVNATEPRSVDACMDRTNREFLPQARGGPPRTAFHDSAGLPSDG
jgi:hypothetical protein